jgi:surfactin synthase thioesterase subunit
MPKNFVRWINFIVPGFDGADERRGSYKGTLSDIIELIFLLLRDGLRSQNKVVLLGHSMGSYICYAFA